MAAVNIDYTSRDYAGLRASMLAYAESALPEWTSRSPGDFGVVMVELMAYVGDIMSYYVDRAQAEAYLSTATLDSSIVTLANTLGYVPRTGVAATGKVRLILTEGAGADVALGTQLAAVGADGQAVYYETTSSASLRSPGTNNALLNVREGVSITKRPLGVSSGLPGQSFLLDDVPLLNGSLSVEVDYTNAATTRWKRVDFLADASAADPVFKTELGPGGALRLVFGDGINGSVPAAGLVVYASYVRGGGARGNLGASTEFSLVTYLPGVAVARLATNTNLPDTTAMAGGIDADDRGTIRRNVPVALRTRDRAVTLSDYTDLTLSDPAITKAAAVAQHPGAISVYVATSDPRAADAAATRARVQTQLQTKVPAGVVVLLYPIVTKSFTIASPATPLAITAYETYVNLDVQVAVEKALRARYALSAVVLGEALSVSEMYRTILGVPGVRAAAVPTWAVAGGALSSNTYTLAVFEVPVLTTVSLSVSGGIG